MLFYFLFFLKKHLTKCDFTPIIVVEAGKISTFSHIAKTFVSADITHPPSNL